MAPFPTPTTATDHCEVDPWDLRDPGGFLARLARLVPLAAGTIVALVHLPSTRQEVQSAVRIEWSDDPPTHDLEAELDRTARSEILHDVAHQLWGTRPDRRGRPEHAFVTVVVRPGRVVFGPAEYRMLNAWRYANYFLPVHRGDLLLVTPHGWRASCDDSGAAVPALEPTQPDDTDRHHEASWEA